MSDQRVTPRRVVRVTEGVQMGYASAGGCGRYRATVERLVIVEYDTGEVVTLAGAAAERELARLTREGRGDGVR